MLINHQKMLRIERYGPSNVSRHPASALVEKICMFEFRKKHNFPKVQVLALKKKRPYIYEDGDLSFRLKGGLARFF